MTSSLHKKAPRISVGLLLFLAIITVMIVSTPAKMTYAATQTLPTCTDPTGQNLPCMMVISTLPPPPNALQCQETTGQILPCSYATQILNNGQQIVVITVYVPPNFIFVGGTISVVKVLHEESSKSRGGGTSLYTLSITIKVGTDPIIRGHVETITVIISDKSNPSRKIVGANVGGEVFYHSGFHKSVSCSTTDQNGKSQCSFIIGPNSDPGTFKITIDVSASGYKPASKSVTFTVITKPNATSPVNSTIPANTTNATSTNLSNMSSLLFKLPSNTSAVIQPNNKSIPTSGGEKSKGTTCTAGNCTSGTGPMPPLDCNKDPNDPSCTQTLAPPPISPTSKKCPDGSQPNTSGKCPTLSSLNPNNPSSLNGKKKLCPDGSIIPKRDKCPAVTQPNPSSSSTGSSSPSNPSGSPPPPSGISNSDNGGSSSSSPSSGSEHHRH